MFCGVLEPKPTIWGIEVLSVRGFYFPLVVFFLNAFLMACSQNYSEKDGVEALSENGFKPLYEFSDHKNPIDQERSNSGQSLGGVRAFAPSGWRPVSPANSMRIFQYELVGQSASDHATLAVFKMGGSVEENVGRWYRQFSQPESASTEEGARQWQTEVSGMPVTFVDLSGTYTAMGPMGQSVPPQAQRRMLAAIVEGPRSLYFFKLIGSIHTVGRWESSFYGYIQSLRQE